MAEDKPSPLSTHKELEDWLTDKPAEWAKAIASRASLRVLPVLVNYWKGSGNLQYRQRLTLTAFRDCHKSWATTKYQFAETGVPPKHAFSSTPSRVSDAVASARLAAQSASAQTVSSVRSYSAAGVAAAASSARAYKKSASIWESVHSDSVFLTYENRSTDPQSQIMQLLSSPLWLGGEPEWIRQALNDLTEYDLFHDSEFDIWIGWYNSLLGNSETRAVRVWFGERLDNKILVQSEKFWGGDVVEINQQIAEWYHEEQRNNLPMELEEISAGWAPSGEYFQRKQEVQDTDKAVAEELATQQLHDGLRRRVREFSEKCQGLEDTLGWVGSGFEEAIRRFAESIDVETTAIPLRIAELYDRTVDLGSYLDLDSQIRAERKGNENPLDAPRRRDLESLVRAAAPFVRRFPTAQDIDDEAGAFLLRDDIFVPAISFANQAGSASVISKDDLDLLLSLLRSHERDGALSQKAKTRGFLSVRGLGAAVLSFYLGIVGSYVAPNSVLVGKTGELVLEAESDLLKLLFTMAPDQRNALILEIEDLKAIRRRKEDENDDDEQGDIENKSKE